MPRSANKGWSLLETRAVDVQAYEHVPVPVPLLAASYACRPGRLLLSSRLYLPIPLLTNMKSLSLATAVTLLAATASAFQYEVFSATGCDPSKSLGGIKTLTTDNKGVDPVPVDHAAVAHKVKLENGEAKTMQVDPELLPVS
jgi:hypothetical protein